MQFKRVTTVSEKHGNNGMAQRDSLSPGVHAAARLYWVRDMHAPLSNCKAREMADLGFCWWGHTLEMLYCKVTVTL